jgi:two-component system OmpR family response regulator
VSGADAVQPASGKGSGGGGIRGNGTSEGILVVDDDADFRALVVSALVQAGFEPLEAATGSDALECATRKRPGLVILDVRLPDLSGYEVCRELRDRLGASVPVMFVSGERIESFDRVAGLLVGGDDYLVKPFELDELVARARRLVERPCGSKQSSSLTRRESQVLALLADGLTPSEVAEDLIISRSTVGTHIEHIYEKLGARTRAHAVGIAFRSGVLER